MAINRYVKKAGMLIGMLGIIAGCFQGYRAYAEDITQKTPPEKVNITVHKLMYDQGTQLNVDIDGIKNDGYTHDQYPTGVTKYNKADYGDVEFTLGNITDQVLPTEDSDLTNAKVDEIVKDVEDKGSNSEYVKNATNKITSAVDENGEITFADQPAYVNSKGNVYVVYESKSAAGLVTQKAKPMVVIAPMTDNTGSGFLKDIHLYPKNIVSKLSFELTKFGDDGTAQSKQTPLKGAKFELYKGEPGKGTKLGDLVSDDQGKLTATDLTLGKYYFVEVPSEVVVGSDKEPTADQYLLGADARNDAHNKLTFKITNDGVTSDLKASYVNYKAPVIDKTVTNGTGQEHSFQIGDAVNYQGTIHIPTDIAGGADGITVNGVKSETSPYSVFKWGDTAGQGLSYVAAKANIKVTNKDGSVVLKENTDYKIQNSENGFVIDFIVNNGQVSDTVASLHGQDLQMTYNMYVNQGQKLEKQEGVNGAKFSVYDVSDILQKMDVKDLTTDQIESQLKDRVKKLFSDQLKLVSNGETKTIDQQTGVFEFSIEVQANQKQAYYIVNESSPENISNSEDILLLTPVSDKNGEFLKDVWIYPKSEASQPNALKKVNRLFQPLRSENTNGNWKH